MFLPRAGPYRPVEAGELGGRARSHPPREGERERMETERNGSTALVWSPHAPATLFLRFLPSLRQA